jgi:hypothetical protein
MTDTIAPSDTPIAPIAPIPVNSDISAGIALVESAIEFFETVEEGKYAGITKILDAALLVAKMF